MRTLKITTTFFFVLGIILVLAWPALLKGTNQASKQQLAQYGVRMLVLFAVTSAAFISAAVGALLIVRRQRSDYRRELKENVRELIEGSLNDHKDS